MTTLVALHDPKRGTFFGSDSQASSHYRAFELGRSKWSIGDGIAVGVCGSLAVGAIIHEHIDMLANAYESPFRLGQGILALLDQHKWEVTSHKDGVPRADAGIILATPEGVWSYDSTMAFTPFKPGEMCAAGSGEDFALGADFMMQHKPPKFRLEYALRAAAHYDLMTGGELHLHQFKPLTKRKE